jgi:protein-L-isoaspartate(D-aspartate) O-methyltransferase
MTPSARHQAFVDELKTIGAIRTPHVEAAFRAVPRHWFLPETPPEEVYSDRPILTKRDSQGHPLSSSSQPSLMAGMLEELQLERSSSVLEIGTGTGYNAALMAHIVGERGRVFSMDIDEEICAKARERLAGASFERVTVLCADGALGHPEASPYDRIIVTAGAPDIADPWRQQLAFGGRLVVPLKILGTQYSIAFEKREDHLASRSLTYCGFIMLRGSLTDTSELWPPSAFQRVDEIRPAAKERQTGIEATGEEVMSSLLLWLALREPGICVLQEVSQGKSKSVRLIWTSADRNPWANSISSDKTAGLLLRPGGDPSSRGLMTMNRAGPLSVLQFGSAEPLADRLMEHIRAWAGAGRPSCHDLRIRAYPKDVPYHPGEGEFLVKNEFSQLVLEWPHPPASAVR